MGDFFDNQESGVLCSGCGAYIGKDIAGYCSAGCRDDFCDDSKSKLQKVKCTECNKMLSPSGIAQHMAAKHGWGM